VKDKKPLLLTLAAAGLAGAVSLHAQREADKRLSGLKARSCIADTARGPVEYSLAGSGPAVLIFHGAFGGYDQALVLASPLVETGFQVIAPSRPGYLNTPLSNGETPAAQADMFAALLDSLDISQVAVLSISGGGPAAIQFTARYPDRCRALILIGALSQPLTPPKKMAALVAGKLVLWLHREPVLWLLTAGIRLLYKALTFIRPGLATSSQNGRAQWQMFVELAQTFFPATPRRRGLRNDHRQLLALSTLPLRAVRTPTLILHSQNDLVVSFERVQQAAEIMPGASLMATEDGNHAFFITHYDQIWSAAAQFLRDHL
jgi:pimeloyl-ACP methyl ester carboxylesterase